ncbi:MAG: ATP-binding protein [Muribaculaceae bacterium]|nr:ATP-binding protein [Muribaculaceae bacterium]
MEKKPVILNEDTFVSVQNEININMVSSSNQAVLIIGQNGSGKTFLLNRIYNNSENAYYDKIWIDGRSIFSSDEIIMQCSNKSNKSNKCLLFIDDIDFYFNRCTFDEQYRLRRFLYSQDAPMLIGSLSRLLPSLTDYNAPFFEGMKLVYIKSVDSTDLSIFFSPPYIKRALSLLIYMPKTIRSLEIIEAILTINKNQNSDLDILLSWFAEKYRAIYQGLPTYSQHILNALCLKTDGMIMSEIKYMTKLPPNILTAYLNSLSKNNIINIDKTIKKLCRYSIKDQLFSLWLQDGSSNTANESNQSE